MSNRFNHPDVATCLKAWLGNKTLKGLVWRIKFNGEVVKMPSGKSAFDTKAKAKVAFCNFLRHSGVMFSIMSCVSGQSSFNPDKDIPELWDQLTESKIIEIEQHFA